MENKLLFYISTIRGGGAARVLTNLALQFSRNGWECIFVTNMFEENEYELAPEIKRITVDAKKYRNSLTKNYARIRAIRKIIKQEKPACVISFMDENNFRAVLATRFLRTRLLVSVRSDPKVRYNTMLKKLLFGILYRMADGAVVQTQEAKDFFSKAIQKKASVIFNQVDEKFFETERVAEEYYVAAGRLTKVKNYEMMIRAFSRHIERYPEEKLHIYGSGELDEKLKGLVKSLNCQDSIIFKGQTRDIPSVMSRAKGFFLTSNYEGMPNSLLEALAVGVPSISTDCPCGGPAAVIEDGVNGLLVPVGDEDALVKAMGMLQDEELRSSMSREARKRAEKFAPEAVFADWESCISNLTNC